jgi:hypothetical protein
MSLSVPKTVWSRRYVNNIRDITMENTDRGKPKYPEKAFSRATLPTTNSTWTAMGRDEMHRLFFIRD